MQIVDIKRILENALGVRVPQFGPDDSPGLKISRLEDHLLKCAWHRGELEEALYWTLEAGKMLRLKWDGLHGYENALPRGTKHTRDQINDAKRAIDPGTWEAMEEVKYIAENLRRQISRLGGTDYDAVSRAYTLISGG